MHWKIYVAILSLLFVAGSGCSGGGTAAAPTEGANAVPTSIVISPATASIAPGVTLQFTATGTYSDNSVRDVTALATWASSDTAVATINNDTATRGVATSVSAGTTWITASYGGVTSDHATLAVGAVPDRVTGIAAAPGSGRATISWRPSPLATSYNLYWSKTPGVSKASGARIALPGLSYLHDGLSNDEPYYYVVTAQSSFGESSESAEVMVTPSALLSLTIDQPARGGLTGATLQVATTVSSTFQVQNVTASVAGRSTSLSSRSASTWVGTISLDGLPRGEKVVTVSATDVQNNRTVASASFIFDLPPTITITEPLDYSVARPDLQIVASCSDDSPAGCRSLKVYSDEIEDTTLLASGENSINERVGLQRYDGRPLTLSFYGEDDAGQYSKQSRIIYVESSTSLSEVERTAGPMWDVLRDRILFLDTSDGGTILKIRDRVSGIESTIRNDSGRSPRYGYLTPQGAIFVAQGQDVLTSRIFEWRDGVLLDLAYPNSAASLRVNGSYAIWNQQPSLILRDLIDGTNTTVATDTGNWKNDVAANGDVVYWHGSSYQVYRYSGGITTRLTNDASLWNTYPLTDGINVVYRKHTPCCTAQTYAIAIFTASGEVTLAPARDQEVLPFTDYQVKAGWTAFTRSIDNVAQVFLRSPTGVVSQISYFGAPSSIKALGPNGDVAFACRNRLYLARFGRAPADVASSLGEVFYLDGQWFYTIGRSLFVILQ